MEFFEAKEKQEEQEILDFLKQYVFYYDALYNFGICFERIDNSSKLEGSTVFRLGNYILVFIPYNYIATVSFLLVYRA